MSEQFTAALDPTVALRGLHLLGAPAEEAFDRLTRMATKLLAAAGAGAGRADRSALLDRDRPLQSISSFADLLLDARPRGEDSDDLETIRREALRASGIVANLRLLARQAQDEPGERLAGDELLTHLVALGTGMDRRVIFLTGDAASGHAARVLAHRAVRARRPHREPRGRAAGGGTRGVTTPARRRDVRGRCEPDSALSLLPAGVAEWHTRST